MANEYCHGKIVFVLEGGYDPHNVANGVAAVFDALTSRPLGNEAGDASPYKEPDFELRLNEIKNGIRFKSTCFYQGVRHAKKKQGRCAIGVGLPQLRWAQPRTRKKLRELRRSPTGECSIPARGGREIDHR